MARNVRTLMFVGSVLALVLACDMPWDDDDGKRAPPPPEVTRFVVFHDGMSANDVMDANYPRVTIEYQQNNNPRVVIERSAPHDNQPGFSSVGDVWHGQTVTDHGLDLPDMRLNWGYRYVYRLKGYGAEGGPSDISQEFVLNMPNFHPPNNVQVVSHSEYNEISWSRTTVDARDGRTTYRVYGRRPDLSSSFGSLSSWLNGESYTHNHGGGNWEYRVRAEHDNYGRTAGSAPGEQHGIIPPLPGDGDNGDVVAGENELVYQGQTIALSQLWFDWVGYSDSVFIYLASHGIDVEDSHSGTGGYLALKAFFDNSADITGNYSFAAHGPAGTFDNDSVVVPVNREVYNYVTGGSFTIAESGGTYTISGSVQTETGATAAFSYEGTVTGELGSP